MESESKEKKKEGKEPKKKQVPFNLCFVIRGELGRSYVKPGKPLKTPETVSPKFYSKATSEFKCKNIKEKAESLKVLGPKEKYDKPFTENQRYGWHQVNLIKVDVSDKRLHFAKRTDPLVKEYLRTMRKMRDF